MKSGEYAPRLLSTLALSGVARKAETAHKLRLVDHRLRQARLSVE